MYAIGLKRLKLRSVKGNLWVYKCRYIASGRQREQQKIEIPAFRERRVIWNRCHWHKRHFRGWYLAQASLWSIPVCTWCHNTQHTSVDERFPNTNRTYHFNFSWVAGSLPIQFALVQYMNIFAFLKYRWCLDTLGNTFYISCAKDGLHCNLLLVFFILIFVPENKFPTWALWQF